MCTDRIPHEKRMQANRILEDTKKYLSLGKEINIIPRGVSGEKDKTIAEAHAIKMATTLHKKNIETVLETNKKYLRKKK